MIEPDIVPVGIDAFDLLWPVIEPVLRAGDTYALPADLNCAEARALWAEPGRELFAVVDEGHAIATYYLRPNLPGPGDHVCNAGYMTAPAARGRGLARAMCLHSMDQARLRGFSAMQFNSVVAANRVAVRLWHDLGFLQVGCVPDGFRLPDGGFSDLLVMHRKL